MVTLLRNSNQARGLAEFGINFLKSAKPMRAVIQRLTLFHTDSVLCGLSSLALNTNAPTILRNEAHLYPRIPGAFCFGSEVEVSPEKAILANCAAVREWDANGTVFGYNPKLQGHDKGEYGHNDYYPVVVAAAQQNKLNGKQSLFGMLLLDEIRGRLCEVFSLRKHKIDHVVHGAVAATVTYGALMGANAEQIESALGLILAHFIPFRAIRKGKELSDSKGSSAAFAAELAVIAVRRAMNGFEGPKDIFRNPDSIFGVFANANQNESPFDIYLSMEGDDFSVMDMHFKLGLYEHQSAGAIFSIISLIRNFTEILSSLDDINEIKILCYKDAYAIIGDKDKNNPTNRQSADHSMVYIISTIIRKAFEIKRNLDISSIETLWKQLMLTPYDYSEESIFHQQTRTIMQKIKFEHCAEYDKFYPKGIPSSISIKHKFGKYESGFVLYPPGHKENLGVDVINILMEKFHLLGRIALEFPVQCIEKLQNIDSFSAEEMRTIYNWKYKTSNYLM
ncbi:unnamed protein product [Blepharisma stoltei]|uniref:MmgE/PrpD N-terminal domain-containing protein n=1 Tax=Blepharisma stoltei TaxID=1481888 RepID=A0AAU9IC44_9CILI|nr:unnamed protein product [Blepharisma stoltei]